MPTENSAHDRSGQPCWRNWRRLPSRYRTRCRMHLTAAGSSRCVDGPVLNSMAGGLLQALAVFNQSLLADPARLLQAQAKLWEGYAQLWQRSLAALAGQTPPPAGRCGGSPVPRRRLATAGLRPDTPVLSADQPVAAGTGHRRGRPRSGHTPQADVLHAPVRRCAVAVELRRHQSGSVARHGGVRRTEPAARLAACAGGHEARRRAARSAHDRPGRVRGRRQHRRHARQGGVPERPHATDPVHPGYRSGVPAPAAGGAAVDQQVLCDGPAAEEFAGRLVAAAGLHGVHDFLGQPGAGAGRQVLRGLHARGPAGGAGRHRTGLRRARGERGRLLHRRHAAAEHAGVHGGHRATSGSSRRPPSPACSISASRATWACSSTRTR